MPKYKVMEQIYRKNSLGGVGIAYQRMMNSGFFDKYEMQTLEQEEITHGIDIGVIRKYVKEIKQKQPDLIHVRGVTEDGLMPIIAARIAGVKHILIGVEGMYSDTYEINPVKRVIAKYIIEPLSFSLATDIFTVYEGGLSRPKIARFKKKLRGYIYNSLPVWDISDRDEIRSEIRGKYKIDDGQTVVCFVSRINYDKGFSFLKDCLISMDTEWPENIEILIVGEGNYLPILADEVGKMKNRNRIHILGGQTDVRQYYLASDVFASCTLHENHSLSILEACAAHIPSIVTATGGNTETIQDEISGWVIPIKNSIEIEKALKKVSKLTHEQLYDMGEKAYKNGIRKFSPQNSYLKMQIMYDSILESD